MNLHKFIILCAGCALLLTSCDHPVTQETIVYPDGSLDKTVTLVGDSSIIDSNFMGIQATKGWDIVANKDTSNTDKLRVQFKKHFESVADINQELGRESDSLFRITSQFEKRFRWFYTYLHYAETYHAINRFDLPLTDYFTEEDFSFITRMPPEGSPLSKADSLYLERLHEKIFDVYGTRAIFEKFCDQIVEVLESKGERAWIDTLHAHQESLYADFINDKEVDSTFYLKFSAIPGMPLSPSDLERLQTTLEDETDFYSIATNGKYLNTIIMPGTLVKTNADSTYHNTSVWKPSSTRFLINDYIMSAESRMLNLWAWIVSGIVILLAIGLNFKVRSQSRNRV